MVEIDIIVSLEVFFEDVVMDLFFMAVLLGRIVEVEAVFVSIVLFASISISIFTFPFIFIFTFTFAFKFPFPFISKSVSAFTAFTLPSPFP